MHHRISFCLLALLLGSAIAPGLGPAAWAQEEVPVPVEDLVETLVYPYLRHYEYYAVSDEVASRGLDAVGPLVERVHSTSQLTQLRVLGTLSRIGPDSEPALNGLLILLRDRDPMLRAAAAEGIGALGEAGQTALPDLFLALEDADKNTVAEAARAIGAIDPEFVALRLSNLLQRMGTEPFDVRLLSLRQWYRIACRNADDPTTLRDLRKWTLVVHFSNLNRISIADVLGLP